jgi:UTP--glucose-1-phosphate uridylyltransferase
MSHSVRKAILPVAGLGTRFLPATKSSPKEMLPIVDKPLVQYAVEEAVAAGVSEIIFVTSRAKRAIEDHFDSGPELEALLQVNGKQYLLDGLRRLFPPHVRYAYVRQPQALGLGHAVLCARALIGDEPFAVLLPDDLMDAQPPVLGQMLAQFEAHPNGCGLVAVESVPLADTERYGIVEIAANGSGLAPISRIVEKPLPSEAPSTMAVVGRYVFSAALFDCLEQVQPGAGGEIQLTDAIAALCAREAVYAYAFQGKRFDCGTKIGYLAATVHFALKHPEVAGQFGRLLQQYAPAGTPKLDQGRRGKPAIAEVKTSVQVPQGVSRAHAGDGRSARGVRAHTAQAVSHTGPIAAPRLKES